MTRKTTKTNQTKTPDVPRFEESKCGRCTALCCRYFGLEIDKPEDERDFDQLRWYLIHEGTEVYVDEGHWFLNILSTCRHLLPDNRCGIYENRPYICRDYDSDSCEFENELKYEHYFRTHDELVAYMRERGIGGSYLKPGEVLKKPARQTKKKGSKSKVKPQKPAKRKTRLIEV